MYRTEVGGKGSKICAFLWPHYLHINWSGYCARRDILTFSSGRGFISVDNRTGRTEFDIFAAHRLCPVVCPPVLYWYVCGKPAGGVCLSRALAHVLRCECGLLKIGCYFPLPVWEHSHELQMQIAFGSSLLEGRYS